MRLLLRSRLIVGVALDGSSKPMLEIPSLSYVILFPLSDIVVFG